MSAVRTSKRVAAGGFLAACFLVLCLLAAKDMNDKLTVMTASNAQYQKMTDSQADKIMSLAAELESTKDSKASELRQLEKDKQSLQRRVDKLQRDVESKSKEILQQNGHIDSLTDENGQCKSREGDFKRSMEKQRRETEKMALELRDQIAKSSLDRDNCHRQYAALFKLHQDASDTVQTLTADKQRLEKTSPQQQQQQQVVQQQALKTWSSSSSSVGLEQPHVFARPASTQGQKMNNFAPPVAAEPPLVRHQDVMEAPRQFNQQQQQQQQLHRPQHNYRENLDAQVDPVQQDHPGLPANIYREHKNGQEEDEDDMEDAVDGQIVFGREKQHDNRYDHVANDIDYDFNTGDDQVHVRQQQHVRQQDKHYQQQPLVIHKPPPPRQHQQQQRIVHHMARQQPQQGGDFHYGF